MKLLIVDDEYHVIKTIKYLIGMSNLDIQEILEAESVKDAIHIIEQEHPEILITDVVMTDVTGLELMNYLNNTSIPIKTIVISGYNNFEYIRAALQGGGVDYLLKPIDADQLTKAVQKAMDAWIKEDTQKRQTQKHLETISRMSSVWKETLLYRIMTRPSPDESYQELVGFVPSLKECRNCIVGYYNCQPFLGNQSSDAYQRVVHGVSRLGRILEEQNIGSCFFGSDNGWEILIFLHCHTSEYLRFLENQIQTIRAQSDIVFMFGFSRPMAFPSLSKDAFLQAKTAFEEQDIFTPAPPLLSYSHVLPEPVLPEQPELEQQLFSALITGNEKLFDSSIDQWIQEVLSGPTVPLHHALALIQRFNLLMEDWKRELVQQYSDLIISSCQPLVYHQFLDSAKVFSIDTFKKAVKMEMFQLSAQLTSPSSHPQSDVIYQVAHYIRLNYNKPFSQFACAQLFFINKNYMCRKFKNTFHVSMISYLNQIRIDHAKELLTNPGMKIKDIAYLVGFEDEKYFSRQFHKNTGLSPNEYRNQLGNKDNAS